MKKCDVIIPVYKSPEWVKLCIYSIFKNTNLDTLNKVYLINDCKDELTINCLNNLKSKYFKIEILTNEENLGFVKTTNKGMKASTADYVLLLNTDCIIAHNTIEKLISHMEKNENIGLICPVSSNAANLTLKMFDGFSYMQMDKLLEEKFSGLSFDACTVVGNCLMISRRCINEVGYLDEIYGMGYGEETDYQFKAMEKGFEAKVAIDTYVFHKAEVSFGKSKEKQKKLEANQKIFFDRWGEEYNELCKKYSENDPIKYILANINEEDKANNLDFLIYLMGFSQNAGGVHMTVDMVNYLVINNINCNILYGFFNEYNEILLFNPIPTSDINKYKFKFLASTIYLSTFYVKKLADQYNVPLLYFAQGYEPYFENGINYGIAELSYKMADHILTISTYLKDRYKDMFNVDSHVISNGINYDLIHHENTNKKVKTITLMLRDNVLKGDFILLDLLKKITNNYKNLEINLMYSNKNLEFPFNNNESIKINKYLGPFTRKEIADILKHSDLYIDTSLTEGFGLMALEAMTAGNVVVVSDSGGVHEYIEDGVNGYVVNNVNNVDAYIEKIDLLLNDSKEYLKLKQNMEKTIKEFDYDNVIDKYIKYFNSNFIKKDIVLNEEETNLYNKVLDSYFRVSVNNKSKSLFYKICRRIPKSFRIKIKNFIEKIYKFTNER